VKFRVLIISILILIISRTGNCQSNDFGIWYGINAEIPVNKKLEADISATLRTFNNASKTEQAFLEAGLSYKFNKFFSVAGAYRFINNLEDDNLYHIRHKLMIDTKGSLPLKDLTLSIRIRLQVQALSYFEDEEDKIPGYTGRIKLRGIYNIPKFPLNPYISFESFSPLFENSSRLIGKQRITGGFEYKIVKKHSVEIEYIFQRDYIPRLSDISIISVAYKIKL